MPCWTPQLHFTVNSGLCEQTSSSSCTDMPHLHLPSTSCSVQTCPIYTFLQLLVLYRHAPSTPSLNFLSSSVIQCQCKCQWNIYIVDCIEQGLTYPPTQYRLSRRRFYRWKDPTNSIKVLKEKLAYGILYGRGSKPTRRFPPCYKWTSKKQKPYHSGSSPARQSPTQQAGL